MPCGDVAACGGNRRIGDADFLPIFVNDAITVIDTNLVTVVASDGIIWTRSIEHSRADPKANPDSNASANAPAGLHHAVADQRQARLSGDCFRVQLQPRPDRQH